MSALLKLREWLNHEDAVRYVELHRLTATPRDLFLAYAEAQRPLRIAPGRFYYFEAFEDGHYPTSIYDAIETPTSTSCADGEVHFAADVLEVVPGKMGFSESAPVWVKLPAGAWAESGPIYQFMQITSSGLNFQMVSWGSLTGKLKSSLLFKREHLDEIVSLALGTEQPSRSDLGTNDEPSYNWPLIVGALLDLLTSGPVTRRNQSGVVSDIAEKKIWGLGERRLQGAFAEAQKVYSDKQKK